MTLVQWLSVMILLAALLQVALAVVSAWQRQRFMRTEHQIKTKHLQYQGQVLKTKQRRQQLSWQGYRKFIVTRKVEECDDVCSFYLQPHDGLPIPDFKPGQHLTFSLRAGADNKAVVRCYSLSEAPSGEQQNQYRVSIKRIPAPPAEPEAPAGLVSGFWHDQIQAQDLIDVKAPSGNFFLQEHSARPVVLIAGGIGVTPMLCMFQHLINQASKREVWFFYGVDHQHQVLNFKTLQDVAASAPYRHLRLAFSKPSPACVFGEHYHRKGFVSVDWIRDCLNLQDDFHAIPENQQPEFYVCGPPPMMGSISADLHTWGVPEDIIYSEAFGPASIMRVSTESQDNKTPEQQFSVQFKRSGRTLKWSAQAGSLLAFAEQNNIPLDAGCRCGECGTCEIAIIDGQLVYPEREPQCELTANSCLACIGVPGSDLILDA